MARRSKILTPEDRKNLRQSLKEARAALREEKAGLRNLTRQAKTQARVVEKIEKEIAVGTERLKITQEAA